MITLILEKKFKFTTFSVEILKVLHRAFKNLPNDFTIKTEQTAGDGMKMIVRQEFDERDYEITIKPIE